MPALTPYPGESPLDFERRRQAQAGNTVAAGIASAAPTYGAGVAGQLFGAPADAAPNGSTWTPTVATGRGSPATTPASWGTPQDGRLTQTPGLKYDPKLGGGDVVLPYDPRGEGYVTAGVPRPGAPPTAPASTAGANQGRGNAWYNDTLFGDPQLLVREAMRLRGMDPRGLGAAGRFFLKKYGKMLPSYIQALVTGAGPGGVGMTNVEGGMRGFMDQLFASGDGGAGFYGLLGGAADRALGALPGLAENLSDDEVAAQMQQALGLRLAGAAPVYSVAAQRGLLGAFDDESDRFMREGGDFTGSKAWRYLSTRPDIAEMLGLVPTR